MELFEAIAKRHSYRGPFAPTPVPREDLRRIVEAGLAAPSGCNGQTTTFVIVDAPGVLAAVYEILGQKTPPPALIACVAEPRNTFRDMHFEVEDCAAATENILLAVTALGYATVWLDGMLRMDGKGERIGKLLGVPAGRQVQIILPLGVPAGTCTPPPKLPFEQRAWFNRFGA